MMTYEKPQLNVLTSAVVAIQGGKDTLDTTDAQHERTIPAYQADE
jgi:hypothetical protein